MARRSWTVLLGGIAIVLAAAAYGIGVFSHLSNGGFDDPATDSAKELALEQATFPGRETDLVVIYSSPTLTVDQPAFRDAVTSTLADLPEEHVANAVTWYDTQAPGLVSSDRHATQVVVTLAGRTQDAKSDDWEAVKDDFVAPGVSTSVGGQWAVYGDVNEQVSEDIARAESLSMPIVFLLSLIIFGSLVSALMPTLVGGIAVMGAFAVVRAITVATEVSVFAINVITLLVMGLAIDYALFIVSRFREDLSAQPETSHIQVCLVSAPITATEGSVATPPQASCDQHATMSYVATPQPHLHADLAPLLQGLLTTTGVALLPDATKVSQADAWHVVFTAKDNAPVLKLTVTPTTSDAGDFVPVDVPSAPAVDTGTGSVTQPVIPDTTTPVVPDTTVPDVQAPTVPQQQVAQPVAAPQTITVGYAYPVVWLLPLAFLVLVPLAARALTRDLTPKLPAEA